MGRHSFASALISAGESLEHIGALLGHCRLQATKRYSHLSLEPLREVSNHFGKIYREAGGRLRRRSSLRSAPPRRKTAIAARRRAPSPRI
jgi:site-specific recombinase XerC